MTDCPIPTRPRRFKFHRKAMTARLFALSLVAGLATMVASHGARAAGLEATFGRHAAGSQKTVDHGAWSRLLEAHVKSGADGLNRVDYATFKSAGHAELKAYLAMLQSLDVTVLDRPEQFAFWANLYNAKTVDIILDKYPVRSIKDISLGGGLVATFTGGPWKAKVLKVGGLDLSLDDIEHAILRVVHRDPRVHYAVNCASVGCPNLLRAAFTGATLEAQLDAGARAFVNSPRGVRITGRSVWASSIYDWFQADFGGNAAGVLAHVRKYAEPALLQKLEGITAIGEYGYDWRLNDAKG